MNKVTGLRKAWKLFKRRWRHNFFSPDRDENFLQIVCDMSNAEI